MDDALKKQGRRPHCLCQWMERKSVIQADLARATGLDPSLISRWLDQDNPSTPGPQSQHKLAAYFGTTPAGLFRHPDEQWMMEFLANRTPEELERIKAMLTLAFPK